MFSWSAGLSITTGTAVRFGNISVMPQPIPQPTGSLEPSYILDVHSRSGYSGSPVFVYRTDGGDLTRSTQPIYGARAVDFLQLLGVHWGQFPEKWEIERASPSATKPKAAIALSDGATISGDATYIIGLSGMTMAVPAWAIRDVLDLPKLTREREWNIDRIKRERESSRDLARSAKDASPSSEKSEA
jgi:hypothetical protein